MRWGWEGGKCRPPLSFVELRRDGECLSRSSFRRLCHRGISCGLGGILATAALCLIPQSGHRFFQGWGEFDGSLSILHLAVESADVPVDDPDLLTGVAGVFLAPLSHLDPLDEQTEKLRRELLDVPVPSGLFDEGVHVGGGGFQLLQPSLLLRDGVLQRPLLGVWVADGSDCTSFSTFTNLCLAVPTILYREEEI